MADQDFNIKVVTTADTTGIRQTSVELDKLKQQQATFAETARRQQAAAAAAKPASVSDTAGITGTAVGLGTIVTLLTASLSKWKQFNDEQDKWVEGMIKSQEKSRELGLAVADMLDAMKSAERIETEPLENSFDRLKEKVISLKTEMNIAFGLNEYEDVKKIAAALGVVESQLNRVTSALQRQAEEANKSGPKQLAEQAKAYGEASPQAKAILENEKRAREARAAGDEKSADQFQKSADQYRKSASAADLKSVQAVTDTYAKAAPPLSDIEKNKKAFDDYWNQPGMREVTGQMQPPVPLRNPAPNEEMTATPVSGAANTTLEQILALMKATWL